MSIIALMAWIVLGLVSLAGSWLCSGMETGTYTLNRIRLMVRSEGRGGEDGRGGGGVGGVGDAAARVLRNEVEKPERLLGTILIGNNIFAFVAALSITEVLTGYGYTDGQILVLNILILTPLILVFCEALPKELFRLEADRLSYVFVPMITALRLIFTVTLVLPLVLWFARAAARMIGVEGEIGLAVSARERVAMLLKETVSEGGLSSAQAQLVDRAIAFHRLRLADEMVPWLRVSAVRIDWDRARLLRHMAAHPYSRYPVVTFGRGGSGGGGSGSGGGGGGSGMRVVGILRQADVFLRPRARLSDLVMEPVRLSPGTSLREGIAALRDHPSGMIIIEQDGRPQGAATVKDLAEPLTGVLER
jgi:putative hemolysin